MKKIYLKRIKLSVNLKSKKVTVLVLPFVLIILLAALIFLLFEALFTDKIFPRVFIGDTLVTFLTSNQANRVVEANLNKRLSQKLTITDGQNSYTIDLTTASATIDTNQAISEAFVLGHKSSFLDSLVDQLKLILFGKVITPKINIALSDQLNSISRQVVKPPIDASLEFSETAASSSPAVQIKIMAGQNGLDLDQDQVVQNIKNYLIFGTKTTVLPIKTVSPKTTTANVKGAKAMLESLANDPIKLNGPQTWVIDAKTLITMLDLTSSQIVDQGKLNDYLANLAEAINQPVVEGQFNFDPSTGRVREFKTAQEGRELDQATTATLITMALNNQRSRTITLPINTVEPKVTTEQVNNMGIKQLLAEGISNFNHSIENRIFNIGLAASRINGILIAPGGVFSFNNTVGDISGASGYKQAYVINNGRTVLDDGGGVCQVSTTVFRAALNAGLPIVARTAHAYRVGYYEQGFPPGIDATVFAPSVDLQFKNDTPAYVLLEARVVGMTLLVDLYGTPDGRTVEISQPIVTSQTPPPPDLKQDDPTLPVGNVKQVDFAAWGAKVSFHRTVKRDGQTLIDETFYSNYKPWQAVFLVGTKTN